jgi:TatA/E family protein of Tat protein translocase
MIDKNFESERDNNARRTFSTHASASDFGIALLVFGPKKLPELGKGIGDGIRGFKSAMKDHEDSSEKSTAVKDQGKTIA